MRNFGSEHNPGYPSEHPKGRAATDKSTPVIRDFSLGPVLATGSNLDHRQSLRLRNVRSGCRACRRDSPCYAGSCTGGIVRPSHRELGVAGLSCVHASYLEGTHMTDWSGRSEPACQS